ncbi:hypothetical protein CP532_0303 [Ophiocordyceps camponoti-leonardi (nom. inval.)]|nr:hypothetical protein CP532_0303 [Ophiocordyceps camponoti-leonardi (nom. inval.)]
MDNQMLISAEDEWSPLAAVIVGRADHTAFPSEPSQVMEAIMPKRYLSEFRANNPVPTDILLKAQQELDNFASVLRGYGVRVYRPREVDWLQVGGYTSAVPRDTLMVVGNTLIESAFAWRCRRDEVELAFSDILDLVKGSASARICRAPLVIGRDTIYDCEAGAQQQQQQHVINNSRPAFDAADFMRFGKTVIGQLSHVTNEKGVQYLQAILPQGYTVELLQTSKRASPKHIDSTILPLRNGLLIFCPDRITEDDLRRHRVFHDWELHAFPFTPRQPDTDSPPMYTCSPWLVLNALSLDERRIFIEERNTEFAAWLRDRFGMEPILLPFQHIMSIGGSFHCATVDLVRLTREE